jgi:hypothetical protein
MVITSISINEPKTKFSHIDWFIIASISTIHILSACLDIFNIL